MMQNHYLIQSNDIYINDIPKAKPTQNPILEAITTGNIPTLEALLRASPALIRSKVRGRISLLNLLSFAVLRGNPEVVRWLAIHYPYLAIERDADGTTPLIIAASAGNLAAVQAIATEVRNSVDIADNQGTTPLHIAAANGHANIVGWLATQFPRLMYLANNIGQIPFDIARAERYTTIARFLEHQMQENPAVFYM